MFTVNAPKPEEEKIVKYGLTDVLSDGTALFMAQAKDTSGQMIDFYDFAGNAFFRREADITNVFSIIPKNAEALYQLWAPFVCSISFTASIAVEVILHFI